MPLPVETPAPKASSLIKRFQESIDSQKAEAPAFVPRPRQSFNPGWDNVRGKNGVEADGATANEARASGSGQGAEVKRRVSEVDTSRMADAGEMPALKVGEDEVATENGTGNEMKPDIALSEPDERQEISQTEAVESSAPKDDETKSEAPLASEPPPVSSPTHTVEPKQKSPATVPLPSSDMRKKHLSAGPAAARQSSAKTSKGLPAPPSGANPRIASRVSKPPRAGAPPSSSRSAPRTSAKEPGVISSSPSPTPSAPASARARRTSHLHAPTAASLAKTKPPVTASSPASSPMGRRSASEGATAARSRAASSSTGATSRRTSGSGLAPPGSSSSRPKTPSSASTSPVRARTAAASRSKTPTPKPPSSSLSKIPTPKTSASLSPARTRANGSASKVPPVPVIGSRAANAALPTASAAGARVGGERKVGAKPVGISKAGPKDKEKAEDVATPDAPKSPDVGVSQVENGALTEPSEYDVGSERPEDASSPKVTAVSSLLEDAVDATGSASAGSVTDAGFPPAREPGLDAAASSERPVPDIREIAAATPAEGTNSLTETSPDGMAQGLGVLPDSNPTLVPATAQ